MISRFRPGSNAAELKKTILEVHVSLKRFQRIRICMYVNVYESTCSSEKLIKDKFMLKLHRRYYKQFCILWHDIHKNEQQITL